VIKSQQTKVFLTVGEVAEELRMSKMTVYRLCRTNRLAHVRIGRDYRILKDSLDELLRESYQGTDPR
jgi:excisionase family DNA binding protein